MRGGRVVILRVPPRRASEMRSRAGEPLLALPDDRLRLLGLQAGDIVYPVRFAEGRLAVLGRLVVGSVAERAEAASLGLDADNFWAVAAHPIAAIADREVPHEAARALRLASGASLRFVREHGYELHPGALLGAQELSGEADEALVAFASPAPESQPLSRSLPPAERGATPAFAEGAPSADLPVRHVLPTRAANALERIGALTLRQAALVSRAELESVPYVGRGTISEIEQALARAGLPRAGVGDGPPGAGPRQAPSQRPAPVSPPKEPRPESYAQQPPADPGGRDVPLGDDLGTRPRNALAARGMRTLGDVATHTRDELLRIPNFGPTTLGEIEAALSLRGLALREPSPSAPAASSATPGMPPVELMCAQALDRHGGSVAAAYRELTPLIDAGALIITREKEGEEVPARKPRIELIRLLELLAQNDARRERLLKPRGQSLVAQAAAPGLEPGELADGPGAPPGGDRGSLEEPRGPLAPQASAPPKADLVTRDAEIEHMRASGDSLREIAERFGLTRERVRQILASRAGAATSTEAAAARDRDKLEEAQAARDEILRLFRTGKSSAQTALELGLSAKAVALVIGSEATSLDKAERSNALGAARAIRYRAYSDEDLVRAVRGASEGLGRAPTSAEYLAIARERSLPSLPTVTNRFGSWAQALRAAGFEPARRPTEYKARWTAEAVVEALVRLADELGELPSIGPYEQLARARADLPSPGTIRKRFETWSAAAVLVERRRVDRPADGADGRLVDDSATAGGSEEAPAQPTPSDPIELRFNGGSPTHPAKATGSPGSGEREQAPGTLPPTSIPPPAPPSAPPRAHLAPSAAGQARRTPGLLDRAASGIGRLRAQWAKPRHSAPLTHDARLLEIARAATDLYRTAPDGTTRNESATSPASAAELLSVAAEPLFARRAASAALDVLERLGSGRGTDADRATEAARLMSDLSAEMRRRSEGRSKTVGKRVAAVLWAERRGVQEVRPLQDEAG